MRAGSGRTPERARTPRRDPRYGSGRWRQLSDRVLGRHRRRDGSATPITALCWWPDVDPHPAEVADHIVAVYVGMPDAEFYGRHNVRPSCQSHNKARGFLAAAGRPLTDAERFPRPSIFSRRRARR
jgi:hypothetical protein